ncbi:MAG: hypothetical protein JOZ39_00270 [Chloroflexi bacterium]|nr:hypothetical protein [Chloroflexota bacterium]
MAPEDVLATLADYAGLEIQSAFGLVGCILATRLALEVVRAWKLHGRPLSVRALARNAFSQQGDACLVRVGYPIPNKPADYWPGHLVLICDDRWLLDLSIQQVNVPQMGTHAHPFYSPVSEEFLTGKKPLEVQVGDTLVTYQAVPDDRSYRAMPDWGGIRKPSQLRVIRDLVQAVQRRCLDNRA